MTRHIVFDLAQGYFVALDPGLNPTVDFTLCNPVRHSGINHLSFAFPPIRQEPVYHVVVSNSEWNRVFNSIFPGSDCDMFPNIPLIFT